MARVVKHVSADNQIVERSFRHPAEHAVCCKLQRFNAIELVNEQCKIEHSPLSNSRLNGLEMQQLAQRKHRCRLIVHVDLSPSRPDSFSFLETSSEERPEDLACTGEDARVDGQLELWVVAVFDYEGYVAEFADALDSGVEQLYDSWQGIIDILAVAACWEF